MFNPFKTVIKRSRMLSSNGWSPFFSASNGQVVSVGPVNASAALNNSDVFAVVYRISSDVAACRFEAPMVDYRLNHPMGTLINGYNVWQSVVAQMALNGNAYMLIRREGTDGVVTRLEPIPEERVTVTLNDDGSDVFYTIHFDDSNRSGDYKVPSANMLHFRLFVNGQSESQYMGVSPLMSLAKEIDVQDQSNRLALSTLKHALAPTNILSIPQGTLNDKAKDNIRNEFEKANSGENAGRAIVLDQGLSLSQLTVSPDIAKLLANTNFSQAQIAKAFCVPADYLSGKQDEQSSIEQVRSLYQNSLTLYIRPIEDELTSKLGVPVHLDVSTAVDIDHQQLISNIVSLTNSQNPVLSGDDARQILVDRGVLPKQTYQTATPGNQDLGGDTSANDNGRTNADNGPDDTEQ